MFSPLELDQIEFEKRFSEDMILRKLTKPLTDLKRTMENFILKMLNLKQR